MSLDKSNFRLDGQPSALKIVAAIPRKQPPRAMLAVDLAGSRSDRQKARVLAAVASGALRGIPPNASLAFVTFDNQIRDQFDFSTPRQTIARRVEEISREGLSPQAKGERRALYDSLADAIKMFGTAQPADTVLLIRDVDSHSRARF